MSTNNILPFCPDDTGTNLLTQGEYAVAADRDAGNQPGIASSKLVNKALRQSSFITSQIAQFLCDVTGNDVLDDGNTATLLATMKQAWAISKQSNQVINLGVAASVAANAMTISIKTQANANPSALDPVIVGFRSSTLTSGLFNQRTLTSALSLTIPSSATLGQRSTSAEYVYVYLIDNAGTLELAVSTYPFRDEGSLTSTTAISASATSRTVMYSGSARSNVPFRMVGRIKTTQATSGAWASAPSAISVKDFTTLPILARAFANSNSGTFNNASPLIVNYDTIAFDPFSTITIGASWKWTAPEPGNYLFTAGININPSANNNKLRGAILYVDNGSVVQYGPTSYNNDGNGQNVGISILQNLSQGQYVDIRAQTNDTSNNTVLGNGVATFFYAQRVGDY